MRELKFRAWDKTNKKWAYVGFHLFGEVTVFNLLSQYKFEDACNDLEFTQYTGISDFNVKEIYEGDILILSYTCYSTELCIINVIRKMIVIFDDGGFKLKDDNGVTHMESVSTLSRRGFGGAAYEVIGNIYENPELVIKTQPNGKS